MNGFRWEGFVTGCLAMASVALLVRMLWHIAYAEREDAEALDHPQDDTLDEHSRPNLPKGE